MRREAKLALIGISVVCPLLGCGPQGLAPSTRLLPLPRLPHALVRSTDGLKPAGYYLFTEQEWQKLDRSRCRFDPRSAHAARLYRRGFSNAEIIQACRDVQRYARGDPRRLEQLAAYRRSGLELASFRKFVASGRSLTDYYNRERIGGSGLALAGWILTGLGSACLVGIAATLITYSIWYSRCNARYADDELGCDHDGGTALGVGLVTLGMGGFSILFVVPGLPLVLVGQQRKHRWLRGRLLDVGHVHDLDRFRLRYLRKARRRPVRPSVAPMITRGGGGLTFRLQW